MESFAKIYVQDLIEPGVKVFFKFYVKSMSYN